MATRLFRSIVVFGTTLGAGGVVVATVPLVSSGCSLAMGDDSGDDSWHGIIDAALPCRDAECPDAWYYPISDGPWPIIDAPVLPDAAPPDAGFPDAAAAEDPTQPETTPEPTAEQAP